MYQLSDIWLHIAQLGLVCSAHGRGERLDGAII
jgi:hypothetical protein